MVVWCAADRSGDGDASGMSDPEVCISGGVGTGRTWSLVGKEVKIGEQKLIRKLYFTYYALMGSQPFGL